MRTVERTLRSQTSRKRSAADHEAEDEGVGEEGPKVEVSAGSNSVAAGTIRPPRLPMLANFSHALHGSLQ